MSGPMASIGGLASGLDTQNMVQQLLQLEAQPMQAIQQRQGQYRAQDEAWGNIVTQLSNVRAATDGLTDGSWVRESVTANSSSESTVRATASGSASPGSVTFEVQQLAATHQVALGNTFASPDTTVGPGSFTVSKGGQDVEVQLGEGASIADAARALNGVDGISAQLLRTGDGQHQLVVSSRDSGAAGSFEIDVDGLVGFDDGVQVLRQGRDAVLNLGGNEPGTELLVHRSSNDVDDLLEGVSLRLRDTGQVTIEVEQDNDAAVENVQDFVKAVNGLFEELSKQGKSAADAENRGPLSSSSLVRSLAADLRSTIAGVQGEGPFANLMSIGIELTRDGKVELNETTLRDALRQDSEAVADLLGRTANASDPRVDVTRMGGADVGDYDIQIDTAATIASRVGATYTPPNGDPKTFTITVPGRDPVEVTIDVGDDLVGAMSKINSALADANVQRIRASQGENGEIVLAADRAGTSGNFTVEGSGDLGLDGTFTGQGASGTVTIDGVAYAADGSGQSLTVRDGPAKGMVFRIPTDATGAMGSVSVTDGLGGTIDRFLRNAEGSDGSIARARDSIEARIESANQSLERFENRLEIRERTLMRQFTALETSMSQAQQQGQWLAGVMGGMM